MCMGEECGHPSLLGKMYCLTQLDILFYVKNLHFFLRRKTNVRENSTEV